MDSLGLKAGQQAGQNSQSQKGQVYENNRIKNGLGFGGQVSPYWPVLWTPLCKQCEVSSDIEEVPTAIGC